MDTKQAKIVEIRSGDPLNVKALEAHVAYMLSRGWTIIARDRYSATSKRGDPPPGILAQTGSGPKPELPPSRRRLPKSDTKERTQK